MKHLFAVWYNILLKNCEDTITHIFNGVMRSGLFPSSWKGAKLSWSLNSKSVLFSNKIPSLSISDLPSLSKVWSNTQLTNILQHTFRPEQFGFCSEHPTTPINVINSLADGFNKHIHTSDVVLIISKAIDEEASCTQPASSVLCSHHLDTSCTLTTSRYTTPWNCLSSYPSTVSGTSWSL